MNDVTRALLESALESERLKIQRTSNQVFQQILNERIAHLQDLLDAFAKKPVSVSLSQEECRELLRKLLKAADEDT